MTQIHPPNIPKPAYPSSQKVFGILFGLLPLVGALLFLVLAFSTDMASLPVLVCDIYLPGGADFIMLTTPAILLISISLLLFQRFSRWKTAGMTTLITCCISLIPLFLIFVVLAFGSDACGQYLKP